MTKGQITKIPERPAAPTKAEMDHEFRLIMLERGWRLLDVFIRVGGAVACFYVMGHAVERLAGQTTTANIWIRLLADARINQFLGWIFGGGCLVYAQGRVALERRRLGRKEKNQ